MRKKQTTKFSPSRKSRDGDFYATNISLTSFLRYAILKLENNYTNTYTFTYDDEGRRTSKSNGSVTTYYYYSGNSLEGKYAYSKQVLKTAKSPTKIANYTAKMPLVKNAYVSFAKNGIQSAAASAGANVFLHSLERIL